MATSATRLDSTPGNLLDRIRTRSGQGLEFWCGLDIAAGALHRGRMLKSFFRGTFRPPM
ncbi:unnamed protein product [Nezara viridula]|uniref:Uncharacterized protein n=1 Tax=Nezara viridula TaxID=85310 RepID=A0A9P0MLQ4_NEZVI|nr:unnamed protein product [Nezara viridula]